MKSLFIVLMTLISSSLSFADAEVAAPRKSVQASCDVRQWGNGKVHMNEKNMALLLQAGEDTDVPMYDPGWLEAEIVTPVGRVGVTYDTDTLKIHYHLVLGSQAAPIIADGRTEAQLTVFLGPTVGDNNGLRVSCRLVPTAAKAPAASAQPVKYRVFPKFPYISEHWK